MSTPCPKCGTLLLGQVNRCWRCGTTTGEGTPVAPEEKFPTIRPGARIGRIEFDGDEASRAEVATDEPLAAIPVERTAGDATILESTAMEAPTPERVGSPFAAGPARRSEGTTTPGPRSIAEPPSVVRDRATRTQVSRAGAYGVWALATLAFVGVFFTAIGAACVALVGLTFGLWGLYSDRKALALGGVALCLLLFLYAGFYGATDLYILNFGRSPWTPPPVPPGP